MESNSKNLQLINFIQGHQERIWQACWHPSGDYLATSSADKSIKVWKFDQNNILSLIFNAENAHERSVRTIKFSPDGNYFASGSFDGFVSIWKFVPDNKENELEKVTTLDGHESEVKSVAWSFCHKFLASCSRDKRIIVWDISEEEPLELSCNDILEGHTQDVKCLLWDTTGDERLFSASYDNTIKVWENNDEEWECVDTVSHESTVWSIALSSDSKLLVSASDDLSVKIWKVRNGKIENIGTFPSVHTMPIYSVHIKENLVVSAGGDNSLGFYSFSLEGEKPTLNLLYSGECHDNDINSCSINPSRNVIVTVSDDELMKTWSFL